MMPHLAPPVPARARRVLLPSLIALALSQAACGTGAQSLPGTAPATGAATPSPTGEKAVIDVTPIDGATVPSGSGGTDTDAVTPTSTTLPSGGVVIGTTAPITTAAPSSGGNTDADGEPPTDTASPSSGGSTGADAEPSTDASSTGGATDGDTASPEDVAAPPPADNTDPDTTPDTAVDASIGCGATRAHALTLINAARAEARFCGDVRFDAADPLVWDSRLEDAALDHSTDMTAHNFFAHEGSDGGSVGTRVEASGYDWQSVGENIAAGQRTIDRAMSGWIDSPGHCRNLMNPRFEDVAIACVRDGGADYEYYWTQVFGRAFR